MVSRQIVHMKKPDVSNLLKWVEDRLKGIVFEDDCQVSIISGAKMYSDTPKTIIHIHELIGDNALINIFPVPTPSTSVS